MADNYFNYLYGVNNKEAKSENPNVTEKSILDESVVRDEAIGTPWTHKFTFYCSNPSKSFIEELKAKDGVVAVYMKEKTNTNTTPSSDNK